MDKCLHTVEIDKRIVLHLFRIHDVETAEALGVSMLLEPWKEVIFNIMRDKHGKCSSQLRLYFRMKLPDPIYFEMIQYLQHAFRLERPHSCGKYTTYHNHEFFNPLGLDLENGIIAKYLLDWFRPYIVYHDGRLASYYNHETKKDTAIERAVVSLAICVRKEEVLETDLSNECMSEPLVLFAIHDVTSKDITKRKAFNLNSKENQTMLAQMRSAINNKPGHVMIALLPNSLPVTTHHGERPFRLLWELPVTCNRLVQLCSPEFEVVKRQSERIVVKHREQARFGRSISECSCPGSVDSSTSSVNHNFSNGNVTSGVLTRSKRCRASDISDLSNLSHNIQYTSSQTITEDPMIEALDHAPTVSMEYAQASNMNVGLESYTHPLRAMEESTSNSLIPNPHTFDRILASGSYQSQSTRNLLETSDSPWISNLSAVSSHGVAEFMQQHHTSSTPQNRYTTSMPQQHYTTNIPQQNYTSSMPQQHYTTTAPQQHYTSSNHYTANIPQQYYTSTMPQGQMQQQEVPSHLLQPPPQSPQPQLLQSSPPPNTGLCMEYHGMQAAGNPHVNSFLPHHQFLGGD